MKLESAVNSEVRARSERRGLCRAGENDPEPLLERSTPSDNRSASMAFEPATADDRSSNIRPPSKLRALIPDGVNSFPAADFEALALFS
jgi:hypothetical protein